MEPKQVNIPFKIPLYGGGELAVIVQATITYYYEPLEGADADGNRAVPTWFVDEIIIDNILDEQQNDITFSIEPECAEWMQEAIEDSLIG